MCAPEATLSVQLTSNLLRMFVAMISRVSSNMGHIRSESMLLGQTKKNLVYPLEATFLVQLTSNLVRMFVSLISRFSVCMGHVRSKSRSLGQICSL